MSASQRVWESTDLIRHIVQMLLQNCHVRVKERKRNKHRPSSKAPFVIKGGCYIKTWMQVNTCMLQMLRNTAVHTFSIQSFQLHSETKFMDEAMEDKMIRMLGGLRPRALYTMDMEKSPPLKLAFMGTAFLSCVEEIVVGGSMGIAAPALGPQFFPSLKRYTISKISCGDEIPKPHTAAWYFASAVGNINAHLPGTADQQTHGINMGHAFKQKMAGVKQFVIRDALMEYVRDYDMRAFFLSKCFICKSTLLKNYGMCLMTRLSFPDVEEVFMDGFEYMLSAAMLSSSSSVSSSWESRSTVGSSATGGARWKGLPILDDRNYGALDEDHEQQEDFAGAQPSLETDAVSFEQADVDDADEFMGFMQDNWDGRLSDGEVIDDAEISMQDILFGPTFNPHTASAHGTVGHGAGNGAGHDNGDGEGQEDAEYGWQNEWTVPPRSKYIPSLRLITGMMHSASKLHTVTYTRLREKALTPATIRLLVQPWIELQRIPLPDGGKRRKPVVIKVQVFDMQKQMPVIVQVYPVKRK